jgi:hypothetical protein
MFLPHIVIHSLIKSSQADRRVRWIKGEKTFWDSSPSSSWGCWCGWRASHVWSTVVLLENSTWRTFWFEQISWHTVRAAVVLSFSASAAPGNLELFSSPVLAVWWTAWTGDQPLPIAYRTTAQNNSDTHPGLQWNSNQRSQCSRPSLYSASAEVNTVELLWSGCRLIG